MLFVDLFLWAWGSGWAAAWWRKSPGRRLNLVNDFITLLLLSVNLCSSCPGFASRLNGMIFKLAWLPYESTCNSEIWKILSISWQGTSSGHICLMLAPSAAYLVHLSASLFTIDTKKKLLTWIQESHPLLLTLLQFIYHFSCHPHDVNLSTSPTNTEGGYPLMPPLSPLGCLATSPSI